MRSVYRSSSTKVPSTPLLIECVCATVYWPAGFWLNSLSGAAPPSSFSPPVPPLLSSLWTSSVLRRENKPRRGANRPCITVDFRPVNQKKRLLWRRRSISCQPNNIFLGLGDKVKVFTLLWFSASSVCFYFVPTCPTCKVWVVYFLAVVDGFFWLPSADVQSPNIFSCHSLRNLLPFLLTCCSVNFVLVLSLNSKVNPFPEVLLSGAKS